MKKNILLTLLLSMIYGANAQPSLWEKIMVSTNNVKASKKGVDITSTYKLQLAQFKEKLSKAPLRNVTGLQEGIVVNLPGYNNEMQEYVMLEVPNFSSQLSEKYPTIKSYQGRSLKDPSTIISLAVSKRGVKAIVLAPGKTWLIEPIVEGEGIYAVYDAKDNISIKNFKCSSPISKASETWNGRTFNANDMTLRNFRLAVATDAEYSNNFNDNIEDVLAGINELLSYINPVYERDLSIHLNLIDNNEEIIYVDAAADPFNANSLNADVQSTLTDVIGEENYDIGIVFSSQVGDGNSGYIGSVCQDNKKGSAYAGTGDFEANGYNYAMTVAHEMGHQFGANHTFSRTEGTGANREPGSGTTIMSYAGLTGVYDVQRTPDAQFLHYSIAQIDNYIATTACSSIANLENNPPVVDAGPSYSIPKETAFKLTANASDPDNDELTYSWEGADANIDNFDGFGVYYFPDPTSTDQSVLPSFRTHLPNASSIRYFPALQEVLEGSLYNTWNMISKVKKTLNFVVQVRDNNINGGQTASDNTSVFVKNTGPFKITSISDKEAFQTGEMHTLTWDIANTDEAPINVGNVNILLSVDGGETFEEIIGNTPNDGEENINLPTTTVDKAFIIVEAVGNIFYAASPAFSVGRKILVECNTYEEDETVAIPAGQGSFEIVTINVPNIGLIEDVNLNVDITHTNIGRLVLIVSGPQDNELKYIYSLNCQGENEMQVTFDQEGESLPINCGNLEGKSVEPIGASFEDYYGTSAQGEWRLIVQNYFGGGNGTINSFGIEFCTETSTELSNNTYSFKNEISMYPNPSQGIVNIESAETEDANVKIYTVTGQQVYQVVGSIQRMKIDLQSFSKGIYFVNIDTGKQIICKKLIIK